MRGCESNGKPEQFLCVWRSSKLNKPGFKKSMHRPGCSTVLSPIQHTRAAITTEGIGPEKTLKEPLCTLQLVEVTVEVESFSNR